MKAVVGVVLVTYNRLSKLKKTLGAYERQLKQPEYIIVVDNASTDGTREFLDIWKTENDGGFKRIVIHSTINLGGSGGFFLGETKALKQNASWIMISDDDAYPSKDYISGICEYLKDKTSDDYSIICGKVEESKTYVNIHRSFFKTLWNRNFHCPATAEQYKKHEFYPDFVSYVGIVVNKQKLKKVGLVDKDFFIWCDDTEHSYRLGRVGKIVCLPYLTMFHDVEATNNELSWKSYYGYRNDLMFFKRHFPFHYPIVLLLIFIKTLASPLKGRSIKELRLRMCAMKDSIMNHLGMNNTYKPGWKP